jgi:hypothetical protein
MRRRMDHLALWAAWAMIIIMGSRMACGLVLPVVSSRTRIMVGPAPRHQGRPTTTSSRLLQRRSGPDHRFAAPRLHRRRAGEITSLNLVVDPAVLGTSEIAAQLFSVGGSTSLWLSFADQGQNLAGIFFQASLLPYLLFLYFLQYRANGLNGLSNFGFQYVLLFVLATIPSGIISKSVYGQTLANTDWLHGGAELLLTVANIIIVSRSFVRLQVAPLLDCLLVDFQCFLGAR